MHATAQYWTHDLSPFLIKFPRDFLGVEGIRYYGLAYLASFLIAWALLSLYNRRGRIDLAPDQCSSLMTALILGVVIGGRLGYSLLYDLSACIENPWRIFRIDQGGMASHGGILGVLVALIWYSKKHTVNFLRLSDVICAIAPIGLMLGRLANFVNGELWGRVTTVPWAVIFPHSPPQYNAVLDHYGPDPRHPSQLYQAGLEGAILFAYLQIRFWRGSLLPGQIAGEFLVGYALLRMFGERFREPDAALIMNLSRGQFYSLFLLLAGMLTLFLIRKNGMLQIRKRS
jgi:phosphatidylglycerol:prolipoprotein diacylglycerol transferase